MIIINGSEFQNTNIVPSQSSEQIILEKLMEDRLIYRYRSLNELNFEMTLRKNIIRSSRLMYESQVKFEIFEHSRCNPDYWIRTKPGGFQLINDVLPSTAINDIYNNSHLYGFECATAMLIVYYHAVLNTIGEDLFNRLFGDLYLYSWHADPDLRIQNVSTRHLIPGDIVYFKNPDVSPETPWWQGENAVVLDDGLYFGHGIGITTAERIIESLNQNRRTGSERSAYLLTTVTRPNFTYLARVTSNRQTEPKTQPLIIHHNEPSIARSQYEYYLTVFYLK
ncbi:protein-glutamine gamma-glutamyltransferase [Aquisalibacillus elongatus]|uniref:Protein-glutamine gamma-glutamyltransferase n=1 Tax=Aquisalibacillus elongatus TaxID=485577 RepID=A0A3N5BD28_9BACI|nr:protein-glutamine gamma-glutamyltransferase [Aquisalibacillus elongatus]RPF55383.1 protein-glutamine gamma-glutamyltransferase [Aquisalibacillus elongatus]